MQNVTDRRSTDVVLFWRSSPEVRCCIPAFWQFKLIVEHLQPPCTRPGSLPVMQCVMRWHWQKIFSRLICLALHFLFDIAEPDFFYWFVYFALELYLWMGSWHFAEKDLAGALLRIWNIGVSLKIPFYNNKERENLPVDEKLCFIWAARWSTDRWFYRLGLQVCSVFASSP